MGFKMKIVQLVILLICSISSYAIQTKTISYSVEQGLSQSTVNSILQDSYGQMWFGTRNGLNVFNGYEFETFTHKPFDTTSIINNEITTIIQLDSANILIGTRNGICRLNILTKKSHSFDYKSLGYNEFVINTILKDRQGRIWAGARKGLFLYNEAIDNFTAYENINAPTGAINTIAEDSKENIWLGTNNGIFKFNTANKWEIVKDYLYNPEAIQENRITSICFDRYDNLWVGTRESGVYNINRDINFKIKHYTSGTISNRNIVSNEIRSIIEDRKGRIWIGTKKGINIYDPFTNSIELITSRNGVINSISQKSIYSLYEGFEGEIWAGTWSGGVNLLQIDYKGFLPITQYYNNGRQRSIGAVSSITQVDNLLWMATENNGIIAMDRNWKTIKHINTKNSNNKLKSNHIKKIYKNHNGNILIGFYDKGLQLFSQKTGKYKNLLDSVSVYDIREYPNNVYWIALRRKIVRLDLNRNSQEAIVFKGMQESTNSQAGSTLLFDKNDLLWVGSRFGIGIYESESRKQLQHFNFFDFPNGNYSMNIYSMAMDKNNLIWIGTSQGLYYLNGANDTAIKTISEVLSQYTIYGIIAQDDILWLSTNNGLIKYTPNSKTLKKHSIIDGLQSNEFIRNSTFNWGGNYLIFGGIKGFNAFKSDLEIKIPSPPDVLISSIDFYNKLGEIDFIPYPKPLKNKTIILPSNQPKITFNFSGIRYVKPNDISYSYKLLGLFDEWRDNDAMRSVAFTNLNPGKYTFIVRAEDFNNQLIGNISSCTFEIQHPFLLTYWAFTLYFIITVFGIFIIRRSHIQKREIKFELKNKKLEHEKLNELNELKTQFFMNVSHEFRTPLTVIHGPIERMIESNKFTLEKEEANAMLRNTKRLIVLLDQILELRKVEKGKSKMNLEYIELKPFVFEIIQLFRTIAYEKNIRIEYISPNNLFIWADPDKLEKVMSNLISNAMKFTPEKGNILIEIQENENPANEEGQVEISVIDNGEGMSPDETENIFNRFETFDKKNNNPKGIGIGLSLAKELVSLHHGDIRVESEKGNGAVFTVILPKSKDVYKNDENIQYIDNTDIEVSVKPNLENGVNTKKPTILVIDDNKDIRQYLIGILSDYTVHDAESVEEAEPWLEGTIPDLIISDLILPGKDGFDFCKQIKGQHHTSHVPFILITAKGNDQNRIHGLKLGADAFIPKPFSAKFLMVWVEKLIASRIKLFNIYKTQITYNGPVGTKPKVSLKDSFLETAKSIIMKNITNADLSVDMLSKEMNMSRSNLHLKFKVIINHTPIDFIRIIRLNHAAQQLLNGDNNIVQVAYNSGFNSPSYFTKCFKQHFKKTPSEFIDESNREN